MLPCSSLLWKVVTYGRKKFYNIGPWGELFDEDEGVDGVADVLLDIGGYFGKDD